MKTFIAANSPLSIDALHRVGRAANGGIEDGFLFFKKSAEHVIDRARGWRGADPNSQTRDLFRAKMLEN